MVVPVRHLITAVCSILLLCPPAAHASATRIHDERIFVPVLIYHHVKWLKPSDNAIERGLTVLPRQFTDELSYLETHGYHTITASQLVAFLRSGRALPSRPVALTFDDGYADVYYSAYHTLRQHHMTATFFIVPGFLGSRRYLTWRQVVDMAAHGMDIEAHTMSHPDLTLIKTAQVGYELKTSRSELEARLHRGVHVMAYPYGDYNAAVLSAAVRAGYWAAFTTHEGWRMTSAALLTLPRVYVDLDDATAIFAGRLTASSTVLAADPN